jgi:hypothetical protein
MRCRTVFPRALALALIGLVACDGAEQVSPSDPGVLAAKGGGGGPGPKVRQAVPSAAPQDTSLTVRVIGSGFDDGSTVRFLLAGQSTPRMVVHATRFVTDDSLDADLTIAVDADVALYDIEVMTLRGKKGIGAEKFSVKLKGGGPESGIPVTATFRDAPGDGVRSDGNPSYEAVILDLGNLRLDARNDTPRQLCFDFMGQANAPNVSCDDGYLTTSQADLQDGFPAMTVGSSMTTAAQVTWVREGYNWFLRFGRDCDSNDVAGRATVLRTTTTTWVVSGTDAYLCQLPVKGRPRTTFVGTFTMPMELTVVQ